MSHPYAISASRRCLWGLLPLLLLLTMMACDRIEPVRGKDDLGGEAIELTCEGCHTTREYLVLLALDDEGDGSNGHFGSGDLTPLEPFQRVFIDAADFASVDANHATVGCVTCHGGSEPVSAANLSQDELWAAMARAHEFQVETDGDGNTLRRKPQVQGISRDPSLVPEQNCSGSSCHGSIVESSATSMHTQQWGMKHKVAVRAGYGDWEACPQLLKDGFSADCGACHATCGQCHVSRPLVAKGGLLESHRFRRDADSRLTCLGCHGGSVGAEFNGEREGQSPDVHAEQGFDCVTCHQESLHGDGRTDYTSRHEVQGIPQCVQCHESAAEGNLFHAYHWPSGNSIVAGLACTVCHSQPYTNCVNCHGGGVWNSASPEGYAEFSDFRIGRNSGQWPNHPVSQEEWVTLRHAPVIRDGFRDSGWPVLDNWAALETWELASPHNIRRFTSQTVVALTNPAYSMADCWMSCHVQGPQEQANARRFLWLSHLDSLKSSIRGLDDPDDYVRANRRVAVDDSITRYWNRH